MNVEMGSGIVKVWHLVRTPRSYQSSSVSRLHRV